MARKKIYTPKVIADPVYGIYDMRPVLPMVETKEFQALADKRQLGMSYLIFPSATHTRMAHSFGAYHATRDLTDRWVDFDLINQEEADALTGYALYHDIGHPAFSHVTEDLCRKDNDGLGLDIAHRLKDKIEACGINYKLFEDIMSHKNKLYLAVHDKNLGMEKLDYLERDGLYTILSRPAGIDYLRKHIYFMKGEIMIDEKVVDNAIEVQNFYLKMYKNVYLRKASVIAQRMFQKMVYHLIREGKLTPDDLPNLTDSELIGIMRVSESPVVRSLYQNLKERELFREAIVIRHEKFIHAENVAGKAIQSFGLSESEVARLADSKNFQNKNQEGLHNLEEKIAGISGIPEEAVLAVPVFNAWRFKAKDIAIYSERGISSVEQRYPAHFKNMEEIAHSYFAFRICTLEQYRAKLSAPKVAKEIFDLVVKSI